MTYDQLTSEQRYTISILLQQGMKQKYIAKAIKVSPSTISRELKRNSGKQGHYNYKTAQLNAHYNKTWPRKYIIVGRVRHIPNIMVVIRKCSVGI